MKRTKAGMERHLWATALAILLFVIMSLSSFYIASEAGHHCHDDECPICACMQACEQVLSGTMGADGAGMICLVPAFLIFQKVLCADLQHFFETPVSQKVRLNN